jgi:small GTP-binding protein
MEKRRIIRKVCLLGDGGVGMLWDILGQKSDDALHSAYYKGANGALLVCDVTREQTVENLGKWKDSLLNSAPGAKIIMVANKADLGPKVPLDKLESMAGILGGKMVMTSAKTGEGVESTFYALGGAIMEAGK